MILQFMPKKNQNYWTLVFDRNILLFTPICTVWGTESQVDEMRLNRTWVFAGEEQCRQLCAELNRALRVATKVFNQHRELSSICGLPS